MINTFPINLSEMYNLFFISGFIRAQVSVPPPVTPISTGRVVTSNGLSVPRLSCGKMENSVQEFTADQIQTLRLNSTNLTSIG